MRHRFLQHLLPKMLPAQSFSLRSKFYSEIHIQILLAETEMGIIVVVVVVFGMGCRDLPIVAAAAENLVGVVAQGVLNRDVPVVILGREISDVFLMDTGVGTGSGGNHSGCGFRELALFQFQAHQGLQEFQLVASFWPPNPDLWILLPGLRYQHKYFVGHGLDWGVLAVVVMLVLMLMLKILLGTVHRPVAQMADVFAVEVGGGDILEWNLLGPKLPAHN